MQKHCSEEGSECIRFHGAVVNKSFLKTMFALTNPLRVENSYSRFLLAHVSYEKMKLEAIYAESSYIRANVTLHTFFLRQVTKPSLYANLPHNENT